MNDEFFMGIALEAAMEAALSGEVPIGAVAVKNDKVIAVAHNRVEELHSVTGHAEFELLRQLESKSGDWRMTDYTFFVTKEPCPMCAGMLINARAKRIVYGVSDPLFGACGGAFDVSKLPGALWHPEISNGVLADECRKILQDFFQKRRKTPKN